MNLSTKKAIAANCQAYITQHKISQSDFAKKVGIGKEFVTHILKSNTDFTYSAGGDKTVSIADKYFTKIAAFIGFELEKTYWEILPTPQLTQAIAILAESKKYATTNLLIGETGAGKSKSVELFHRKNPADTFVVTVGSSDNQGDLIDKIIDKLKITTGKTKSKKLGDIVKKLRSMRENGLEPQIIFDESEYMKQVALCSMKELHDHLNKYCSIVMVGTHQLIENIETLRKRNKKGIPQLWRRIKFGVRKLPVVDTSFKLFLNGISTDVQKYLRSICDNYGELHDVLVPVRREAERTGEEISISFIQKVLNLSNSY